jgi:hypothetical protein
MSNSTPIIDLISVSQAQKEATANALFLAASPAMLYGRRELTSGGLTWGYYGGTAMIGGTPTPIANGTITLAASATNYVEAEPSTGAVSSNTTGFTAGRTRLYQVVTGASTVSSYTDLRTSATGGGGGGGTVKSVNTKTPDSSGNVTLAASDVGAINSNALGAANGAASLDSSGKLNTAQLPDLAIISYLGTVANQTAMLALVGQKGDWCIRSDDAKVYIVTGSDPTQASAWTAISYPASAVYAVFGASGSSHSSGLVPDPGAASGTTKYLREDGTWAVPPGASSGSSTLAGDTDVSITAAASGDFLNYDATAGKWKNAQLALASTVAAWSTSSLSAGISLSNGNATATASGGSQGVNSSSAKSSGKVYFELVLANVASSTLSCGMGNANASLSTNFSMDGNTFGLLSDFGNLKVFIGSGYAGVAVGGAGTGVVISFAVDLDAKLVWMKVGTGNWNNNASANPATGAGGFSFSGISGPFYVTWRSGGASDAITARLTSGFSYAIPTDFTVFGAQASAPAQPSDVAAVNPASGEVLTYDGSKWKNRPACIPTVSAAPTTAPASSPSGTVPIVYDTASSKLWIWTGSAWKGAALA